MLQQLTDQDALYLSFETHETHGHVGGLSLVELPEGYRGNFFDDYRAIIASRIALIPFLHQRLATVPLDLDRPFWVEDEHLDLEYHVRRATVPAPGEFADLESLVARLHAEPLDLHRPLWQFYVLDGLASGQPVIYTKMHHTAMDGVASQVLITTMYDPTPTPRILPRPTVDPASVRGSARNLVRSLMAHRVQQAIRAVQFVPDLLHVLAHLVLPDAATLRFRPIHRVPMAPTTLFNVGISDQRVFAARTMALSAARQIAKLTGTTINDVILAICSGALRGYLQDKQALPARSMTAMVPVSGRDAASAGTANHNGLMLCSLASDVVDPYERLLAIHRSTTEQKQNFELWKDLPAPDLLLPGLGALLRRLIAGYGHSRFAGHPPLLGNLVISNIPGPPAPLYIAGAKIASMYPCSIPFHSQAVNITVESYCDRLDFGLIACARAVPDLAQLADRLPAALAELQQAVARGCPVVAGPAGRYAPVDRTPPVIAGAPRAPSMTNARSALPGLPA